MYRFLGSFNADSGTITLSEKIPELVISGNLIMDKNIEQAGTEEQRVFCWGHIYNQKEISTKYNLHIENAADLLFQLINKAGISGLRQLDGEFTWALQSGTETRIGRDRHGAGPQVYYNRDHFWSRLDDIHLLPSFQPEPDMNSLYVFLALGNINSPHTAFKSVKKIPPGHILTFKNGNFELEHLFDFNDYFSNWGNTRLSEQDILIQYEELHKKAIKRRIEGKKNIALLISGGYDSGGNIAAFRDLYSQKAVSVSVGFKDDPWSEVPLAKLVSEKNDIDFYAYLIDGSEINDIPRIIKHFGDPFQESGLMVNYCAMNYASTLKPDLILGGDGNDQYFGTSAREVAINYLTKKSGLMLLQKLLYKISQSERFNKDNFNFKLLFENEKILHVFGGDNFGLLPSHIRNLTLTNHKTDPFALNQKVVFKTGSFDDFYVSHNYFKDIQKVINEVILFKASRMADFFGNHITFPYMSTDIYEFLKQIPRTMKCRGSYTDLLKGKGVSKYTHKAYLKPRLPLEITARKKQGGFAPLPLFFKDAERRKKIMEYLRNSSFARQYFKPEELNKFLMILEQSFTGSTYWFWYKQIQAFRLFNLLVLTVWWDIYINRNYSENLSHYTH